MESLKNEEAVLCTESEVTNELIINSFLLGVVNSDLPRVTVVKNRLNGVTGEVPFEMWVSLVEDFNELKTRQLRTEPEQEEKSEVEEILETFGEAFEGYYKNAYDILEEVVEDIQSGVEENIKPKAKNIFGEILSGMEDIAETLKPKVQDFKTKGMIKGIQTAALAKMRAKKLRLQTARQIAISEGVATKGFIKRIDKKIAAISDYISR